MSNDFIEGMEILINCKKYIENRIEFLEIQIEMMNQEAKETQAFKRELDRLKGVLGYKVFRQYK